MPINQSETLDVIIRVREAAKATANLNKLDKSFKEITNRVRRLPRLLFNLKTAFAGLGLTLLAKQFNNAAVAMERMTLGMTAATGSSNEARTSFDLLRKESERLGLEFESQAEGFTKLAAAAKNSVLEGEPVRELWVAMAEANTALQLSAEDSKWTLYALTQMISKGKVTAEELRRQLGERLPGAFQIAARAMGVSTKELDKMLEQGKLISEEFIPIFTKQLRMEFSQAAERASQSWTANMNRMKNYWFDFRNSVMQGDLFPWLKAALMTLTTQIKEFKETGALDEWAEEVGEKILNTFETIIMGSAKTYDTIIPILRQIKEAIGDIIGVWRNLPEWVQTTGVVVAILGGKKVAAAIAGLTTLFDYANRISEMVGRLWVTETFDKEKWWGLTVEERARFMKDYRKFGGDLEAYLMELRKESGVPMISGKIVQPGAIESIEDLGEALSGADSATEKAKVVIDYLRGLKTELKGLPEIIKKVEDTGILPKIDPAVAEAAQKLSLARVREVTQTALLKLEGTYKQGNVALEKYFEKRRELIEKQYKAELEALEAKAQAETDIAKKAGIDDRIIKMKGDYVRQLIMLEQEREEAETKIREKGLESAKLIEDLKLRATALESSDLRAGFAQELAELDWKHAEEINRLKKLNSQKAQIDEAYRLQKIEKDKLLLDQERRLHEYRIQMAADVAGGLSNIFNDLYELTGRKQKEFFYLSKAAAIAESVINTSQAATKALAQGGILGIAQAAIITAKGMAEVAKISSQNLAEGGPVLGTSPGPKSDDKLIAATSGEFMQPVSSVKYYGSRFMEAIRQRLIPKEAFSGFNIPSLSARNGFRLAEGGLVPAMASETGGSSQEVVIANYYDAREMERFLSTARGRGAIVNAVLAERNTLRRAM